MNRGLVKKGSARMITVWIPVSLFPYIERALEIEDTDRSKFIRNAIREKIQRVKEAA